MSYHSQQTDRASSAFRLVVQRISNTRFVRPCLLIRPLHRVLAIPAILSVLLISASAGAGIENDASGSRFEQRVIEQALTQLGLERDPAPGGKRFGEIIIVRNNIFARDETPWLTWLNRVHQVTPAWVVEQEIQWRRGEPYDPELVSASVRNLRQRSRLSVVAMVPVMSAGTSKIVDMLVVTRDTFTFHASWESADVQPPLFLNLLTLLDRNQMGIGWSISMNLGIASDTLTIGPSVGTPDLHGTHATVLNETSLVVDHRDGQLDGTQNLFLLGVPLQTSEQRTGFALAEAHDIGVDRYMVGSEVRLYDNPETPVEETVPFEIDKQVIEVTLGVFHGLGRTSEHVVLWGPAFLHSRWELLDDTVDPVTRAAFDRDVLPIDESSGMFMLGYRLNRLRYESIRRYQSFGFTEDISMGLNLGLDLRFAPRSLGSASDFLLAQATSAYTRRLGEWVVSGTLAGRTRWDLVRGTTHDRELSGRIRVATPIWGPVRCHLAGTGIWQTARLATPLLDFGEETGFRGYPSGSYLGDGAILGQIELRSAPVEFLYQLLGLVLFADLGTVLSQDGSRPFLSDVGLGIRWVIPWYSGIPLRLDYAVGLSDRPPQPYGRFSIGTEQVF